MRFKSTWIFALLVIALGAYVFWDFTEQKMNESLAEGEVRLTDFSVSDVQEFQVNQTTLDFKSGSCQITAPIQDGCDDQAVQSFLNQAGNLIGKKILSGTDLKGRESEFGLEADSVTELKWTLVSGKTGSLRIGAANSFDGSFYLHSGDLFVVDREVGQLTNKSFAQLRNKVPWQGPEQIVTVNHPRFKLTKVEGAWHLEPEGPFGVGQGQVEEWIGNIKKIKATEVFEEKPQGLKSFLKISFKGKEDEQTVEMELFSKDSNFTVIKMSTKNFYYQVPQSRMKSILIEPTDFYDGEIPFKYALEKVAEVELIREGKTVKFKKKDKSWENPRLIDFFEKLKSVKAKTFESASRFNISEKNRLMLKDGEGKVLLAFRWGEPYVSAAKGLHQGESLRPVQIQNSPKWVFGVSPTVLSSIEALNFQDTTSEPTTEGTPHDHNH